MRNTLLLVLAIACAPVAIATADPKGEVSSKGSVLIFADIDVRTVRAPYRFPPRGLPPVTTQNWRTIVRLANDQTSVVNVYCSWRDRGGLLVNFTLSLESERPVWFDAESGDGSVNVAPYPKGAGVVGQGLLICFAVNAAGTHQIRWNHLDGSATVMDVLQGYVYEYPALGIPAMSAAGAPGEGANVGQAGVIRLDGLEYQPCALYQTGLFAPTGSSGGRGVTYSDNRLAVATCDQDLTGESEVSTKLAFVVWNADGVKFSNAYECIRYVEEFALSSVDVNPQFFTRSVLLTDVARFTVMGAASNDCGGATSTGIAAVKKTEVTYATGQRRLYSTTLRGAGVSAGDIILWRPPTPIGQ